MTELIDLSGFRSEVEALAVRFDRLSDRVASSESDDALAIALDAVGELQATLEALRVSQEELAVQNDALLESRRHLEGEHDRYRSLFLNAPVAYVVTDVRGVISTANRAAIALLNVDERFLLGKPLVTFVVPSHRTEMRQRMLAVAETSEPRHGDWDVQPRRLPPLPATFDVAMMRSATGPDALLWLIQDLTREASLRARNERLAQHLEEGDVRTGLEDPAVRFTLNELTRMLLDEQSLDDVLHAVAESGRTVIPGAAGVSVSLFEQGRPRAFGATAPWVGDLDEQQYALQEGPCVAALDDGSWHTVGDLDEDRRWPRFASAAVEQGVLSVLSVPLLVRGARLGVLNVYASQRSAFAGNALGIAQRLAEISSTLVANAQLVAASRRLAEELQQALVSRATVDMAKGILMAKLKVDPDTAFEALRDLSQRRHMKLRDLAAELVASP